MPPATHRVSCVHKAANVSCRKEVAVAGVQQIMCEVKYHIEQMTMKKFCLSVIDVLQHHAAKLIDS